MSEDNSIPPVAYWRLDATPPSKAIPPQHAELLPGAPLSGVGVTGECKDAGSAGGGGRRRAASPAGLDSAGNPHRPGGPAAAASSSAASRFSRADSNETSAYVGESRQAGVNRLL